MATREELNQMLEETRQSVKRIQDFEPETIARVEDLGKELNFQDGVEHVRRIVELFNQVAVEILRDFPHQRLHQLKQQADAQYNVWQQILDFSTTGQQNPKQVRDTLIQKAESGYDQVFEQLWPVIVYSVRRSTDFARLEREARASIQSIEDRGKELEELLKERQQEAEAALEAIRKVAEEQGVSQQAHYFKQEAETHEKAANNWFRGTVGLTVALGIYALSTLFLHKFPWLSPKNAYETVQLAVSKILVFATLTYFLVLSARNFMAHRHNAVVNKHRQNSLVTYQALVEAAGDQSNRDIVLTKAADSIFGAQVTGFTKGDGDDGKALSMVNVTPSLPKPPSGGGGSS